MTCDGSCALPGRSYVGPQNSRLRSNAKAHAMVQNILPPDSSSLAAEAVPSRLFSLRRSSCINVYDNQLTLAHNRGTVRLYCTPMLNLMTVENLPLFNRARA